ncbi:MAG: alpha-1,2-fucosyltransferase [Luteolibacter sp.]
MIRIVLLGRTGNNLFQYALGRVLAAKHGVPLVLDASWFNGAGWREVSHFLKLPIQAEVRRRMHPPARLLRKLTGKHRWQFGGFPWLEEKPADHAFDPAFLDAPADCALFGYFQSWRYFASMEDELRSELKELLEMGCGQDARATVARASRPQPFSITSPDSVAVHVRRGDFLNHPTFQVCDTIYYRNAMDDMRARLGSPRFYIFSDDPDWCRQTFADSDTAILDSGKAAANPLHDLHLMSLASHHILANSSYSWWAAWIGKKPGQQVILPPRWFTKDIHAPMADKDAWESGEHGDASRETRAKRA